MEMDRNPSEDDPNDAIEVTTQRASTMPAPDKERAMAVIARYLRTQCKEFEQLSQLRQEVSPY
jgi:hypothetical protein